MGERGSTEPVRGRAGRAPGGRARGPRGRVGCWGRVGHDSRPRPGAGRGWPGRSASGAPP